MKHTVTLDEESVSELVRTDLIDMYNNLNIDTPKDYQLLNALALTIQFYSTQKQWEEFVTTK